MDLHQLVFLIVVLTVSIVGTMSIKSDLDKFSKIEYVVAP